jgi:hypothetical protein
MLKSYVYSDRPGPKRFHVSRTGHKLRVVTVVVHYLASNGRSPGDSHPKVMVYLFPLALIILRVKRLLKFSMGTEY